MNFKLFSFLILGFVVFQLQGQVTLDHIEELYGKGDFVQISENQEQILGICDSDTINDDCCYMLRLLAIAKMQSGDSDNARKYFEESLDCGLIRIGETHEFTLGAMVNVAQNYMNFGLPKEAEELLVSAINGCENSDSLNNHRFKYIAKNTLAILYWDTDQFTSSEAMFKELIDENKSKELDKLALAGYYINLGSLYNQNGKYRLTNKYFIRADSLFVANRELSEHQFYIILLNNKAVFEFNMGQYNAALASFQKLSNKFSKANDGVKYATSLLNIGNCYSKLGLPEKQVEVFEKAKQQWDGIKEKGKEYYSLLSRYAVCLAQSGNFDKSDSLLVVLDNYYIDYPSSIARANHLLSRSKIMFYEKNNVEDSKIYLAEAMQLYKESGSSLTNSDWVLNMKLGVQEGQQGEKRVEKSHNQISEAIKSQIKKEFRYLPEINRNALLEEHLSFANMNCLQYTIEDQDLVLNNVSNNIEIKGSSLLASIDLRNKILSSSNSDLGELYSQYLILSQELFSENATNLDSSRVALLSLRKDSLENLLVSKSDNFSTENSLINIELQDIIESLENDEVLIEFVRYEKGKNIKGDSSEVYYGALVIDNKSVGKGIELCSESELLTKIGGDQVNNKAGIDNLYSAFNRGLSIEDDRKSLYQLLWAEIDDHISGMKRVYFSPIGLLNRFNHNSIYFNEDECLGDRYQMIPCLSSKNIAHKGTIKLANNDAYVVGGVDYSNSSRGDVSTENSDQVYAGLSRALFDDDWKYLKWTKTETDNISSILNEANFHMMHFTGSDASEESFRKAVQTTISPRIMHFATHGYFFPDDLEYEDDIFYKSFEDPMMRSGLILAGGNVAWKGKSVESQENDGILTAYEISNMNLSNTELVVLSACETGLGDIEGSEGVYGLQRAFKKAGVKYLMMSLWQVPDRATKDFMIRFYENYLNEDLPIRDAFNKTQLEMRDRFYDPYNWAGFVLVE